MLGHANANNNRDKGEMKFLAHYHIYQDHLSIIIIITSTLLLPEQLIRVAKSQSNSNIKCQRTEPKAKQLTQWTDKPLTLFVKRQDG